MWSDIPNNVQMRWIDDDGRVTVFRNPSGYSNGNTFDYEGRQLSCEHGGRRVVRYEPIGRRSRWSPRGSRASASIRRTTSSSTPTAASGSPIPMYGIRGNYEGFKGESETKPAIYRVDPQTGSSR